MKHPALFLILALTGVVAAGNLMAQTGEPAAEAEPPEETSPLAAGADAAVYSSYIWRGVEINPDGVFQPEAWLSVYGLGVSVWGNLDLTRYNDQKGKFNELDYTAFFELTADDLTAKLMYIYYDYPEAEEGEDRKTQEAGIELTWGAPFSVGLEAYYDFDAVDGGYLKPTLAYELELDPFTVAPAVGLGWACRKSNLYNFGLERDALVDLTVELGASTDLGKGFYLNLLVSYYTLVDDKLREAAGNAKDGVWGGGSLGWEF